MKLSLQIAVVVVATYILSLVVEGLTLPAPKVPAINETRLRATDAKLDIVFRNPPQTLRKCGLVLPQGTGVVSASHRTLVRVARCLRRRHFITAGELRAVQRDKTLASSSKARGRLTVHKTGWAWQEVIVWLFGGALVAFLAYRHRRRRNTEVRPSHARR